MPKFITISGFKGGQALDLYDPIAKQTFQRSNDLDVFIDKNSLTPHQLKLQAMTLPTISGGSDITVANSYLASDGSYYFVGSALISAARNFVLWSTGTLDSSPTYVAQYNVPATTLTTILEEYKNGLFFGWGTNLLRWGNLNTTLTSFTVTIASPAVFTATTHGLAAGDAIVFTTTGALPTGLTAGTTYYVISAGMTASDFEVSATIGGSAINTSGSQSGSHTFRSTKIISSGLTASLTFLRSHRGLGSLYFVHDSNRTIGKYDNTTVTLSALTVDRDETIVGLEEYGRFVIVGVRGTGSKRSRFLIWDGSATTIDDQINIDDDSLLGFKIVNGIIHYISHTNSGSANSNYIRLSTVAFGGKPTVVKEQQVGTGTNNVAIPNNFSSFGDLFLYGLNGATEANMDLGIYGYGSSSPNTAKFHTLWRLVSTGVVTNVSISSIKHNGSSLIVTWGTTSNGGGTQHIDTINGNSFTLGRPSTGVYESNAIALAGGLPGKIKRITINHKPIPTSTGFTVQIKHYGHYTWGTSVPSEDSYTDLVTPEGSGSSTGKTQSTDNATMTEIIGNELFKTARYVQIKVKFDEVLTTAAPTIVFPILIETEG